MSFGDELCERGIIVQRRRILLNDLLNNFIGKLFMKFSYKLVFCICIKLPTKYWPVCFHVTQGHDGAYKLRLSIHTDIYLEFPLGHLSQWYSSQPKMLNNRVFLYLDPSSTSRLAFILHPILCIDPSFSITDIELQLGQKYR